MGPIIGQTAEEGARAVVYAATNPDMEGKHRPPNALQSASSPCCVYLCCAAPTGNHCPEFLKSLTRTVAEFCRHPALCLWLCLMLHVVSSSRQGRRRGAHRWCVTLLSCVYQVADWRSLSDARSLSDILCTSFTRLARVMSKLQTSQCRNDLAASPLAEQLEMLQHSCACFRATGPTYSSLGPATPYGGANIANIGNTGLYTLPFAVMLQSFSATTCSWCCCCCVYELCIWLPLMPVPLCCLPVVWQTEGSRAEAGCKTIRSFANETTFEMLISALSIALQASALRPTSARMTMRSLPVCTTRPPAS